MQGLEGQDGKLGLGSLAGVVVQEDGEGDGHGMDGVVGEPEAGEWDEHEYYWEHGGGKGIEEEIDPRDRHLYRCPW